MWCWSDWSCRMHQTHASALPPGSCPLTTPRRVRELRKSRRARRAMPSTFGGARALRAFRCEASMQPPARERTEARLRVRGLGVIEFESAFPATPCSCRPISRKQARKIRIAVEGDREGALLALDAHQRARRGRESVVLHDLDQRAASGSYPKLHDDAAARIGDGIARQHVELSIEGQIRLFDAYRILLVWQQARHHQLARGVGAADFLVLRINAHVRTAGQAHQTKAVVDRPAQEHVAADDADAAACRNALAGLSLRLRHFRRISPVTILVVDLGPARAFVAGANAVGEFVAAQLIALDAHR